MMKLYAFDCDVVISRFYNYLSHFFQIVSYLTFSANLTCTYLGKPNFQFSCEKNNDQENQHFLNHRMTLSGNQVLLFSMTS